MAIKRFPYEGFNNAFIGGENGIHANRNCDGTFESDAKNNNYISGSVNGIWTEESDGTGPTVNITATNDNIIGFEETIKDNEGTEYTGKIGENGIYVKSGAINIIAGNKNTISSQNIGIYVENKNSVVNIRGNENNINVNNNDKYGNILVNGLTAIKEGDINISEKDFIGNNDTNINIVSCAGKLYGIHTDENGSINIFSKNFKLNTHLDASTQKENIGMVRTDRSIL